MKGLLPVMFWDLWDNSRKFFFSHSSDGSVSPGLQTVVLQHITAARESQACWEFSPREALHPWPLNLLPSPSKPQAFSSSVLLLVAPTTDTSSQNMLIKLCIYCFTIFLVVWVGFFPHLLIKSCIYIKSLTVQGIITSLYWTSHSLRLDYYIAIPY